MTQALKPYPTYKETGILWLGDVPRHWDVKSLGSLTRPLNQHGSPNLPLLSVVREKGVIPRSSMSDEENHNYVPDDLSNYKVVRKGNLVINKMKAWQGSMGIASQDGVVSPAYFVYDLSIADLNFGHTLLRSKPYVGLFGRASDGVRVGQWDLSPAGLKRIPVVIPPLPEQTAIVRYLDYMDRCIRRYTNAKKKLITLLNEQKQAIIHQAVTRGLDPNVRLKPSGLEWMGEIPEHWEVRRLKYACRLEYGDSLPDNMRLHGDIAVYGSNGKIGTHDIGNTSAPCIVIGRKGSFGKVNFSRDKLFAIDTTFFVDERHTKANLRWLYYVLTWARLDSVSKDSAVPGLDRGEAYKLKITYYSRDEQVRIAEWLDQRLTSINRSIFQINQEIALLREYRTRLVADVVTGKLDVREAAACLPEKAEEEPEDIDALTESEGMPEEADLEPAIAEAADED